MSEKLTDSTKQAPKRTLLGSHRLRILFGRNREAAPRMTAVATRIGALTTREVLAAQAYQDYATEASVDRGQIAADRRNDAIQEKLNAQTPPAPTKDMMDWGGGDSQGLPAGTIGGRNTNPPVGPYEQFGGTDELGLHKLLEENRPAVSGDPLTGRNFPHQ